MVSGLKHKRKYLLKRVMYSQTGANAQAGTGTGTEILRHRIESFHRFHFPFSWRLFLFTIKLKAYLFLFTVEPS
ncbi:unnamed protein product [Citrullus colocynthis]|uniref:Uncharacterized protein n=1 Tax=Citrullus colocynthis TaxID=252529 RepID=A0ABP0Z796_9ROSI